MEWTQIYQGMRTIIGCNSEHYDKRRGECIIDRLPFFMVKM